MNIVTLIGNVGADPEIRYTQSGDPIANVRLATTEKWKNKEGEKQEQTEWHRLVFFGGVAKVVRDYVGKGDKLAVAGKIHYSEWTDKDGNKKYGVEIQIGRGGQLELLGGKKKDANPSDEKKGFEATDDDVPF
jgi:single-strand DNA-binding protein